MSETLGSASTVLEPALDVYTLSLTGIRFEDLDLSQARYPSLIDEQRAPVGVQFEPCLHIRESGVGLLKIYFEIGQEGVTFVTSEDDVRTTSVFDPWSQELPPGVESVKLVGGNLQKCELTWNQQAADLAGFRRLTLLRLFCHRVGPPLSAVEEVEGGIYLAILQRPEDPFGSPDKKVDSVPLANAIKILGFDSAGRPVYDLFRPEVQESLSLEFGLEPAFRCREGQIVAFSLVLDLPSSLNIQFVTEPNGDEVLVAGFLPEGRPFQLSDTTVGAYGGFPNRRCEISWFQETGRQYCATSNVLESTKCYCTHGQGSSFGLCATPGGVPPRIAPHGKVGEFDPTVIQPPSCTSTGICITP
ncbi:MAG TPA: hypothetical protein VH394_19620 [Thermoanaerobaculia bacterium]|jgi:hypothetical protein|nr:hypothetical protein [Thermoanaerobaculia bacterium]